MTPTLALFTLCLALAFPAPVMPRQRITSSNSPSSIAANPTLPLQEALKQQRASLDKQRESIHNQLGVKAETSLAPLIRLSQFEQFIVPLVAANQPAAYQPECPALENGKLDELVLAAARLQSLDPALLRSVIKQESGFKPCAVSIKGAKGLMQLMPATARDLHVSNIFDPAENIKAGAEYLKQMLTRYRGDLHLALAAYNAGPTRADQGGDLPLPAETQNYVAGILSDLGLDEPEASDTQEDLAPPDDPEEAIAARKP